MLSLATHCHTHYHPHPFHFVLFKFKDLVAKQHPTKCAISDIWHIDICTGHINIRLAVYTAFICLRNFINVTWDQLWPYCSLVARDNLQLLSCGADKSIMFRSMEKVCHSRVKLVGECSDGKLVADVCTCASCVSQIPSHLLLVSRFEFPALQPHCRKGLYLRHGHWCGREAHGNCRTGQSSQVRTI